VSAGWFFTIGVISKIRNIPNIGIIDDIYTIGEHSVRNSAILVESLKEIGLDLTGPKTHIILPSDCPEPQINDVPPYLIDSDGKVKIKTTLVRPLGGLIQLGPYTKKQFEDSIKKVIDKAAKRCTRLLNIEGGKQDKLLVLKHLSLCYQYYVETCLIDDEGFKTFTERLDDIHHRCLEKILEMDIPRSIVTPFLPTQDRGFGIVPYSYVGYNLRANAAFRALDICRLFGLPRHEISSPPSDLWNSWKDFSKFNGAPKGRYTPKTWLCIRPINDILTLSDDQVSFYARFLLKRLVPFKYHCPIIVKYLSELNEIEFTEHMMTCAHCAAAGFHERHNAVASQLCRTLRFHSVSATYEPKDSSLPFKNKSGGIEYYNKGGPDIRTTLMEPTYIDVAISKDTNDPNSISSDMKQRERHKLTKYAEVKDFAVLPFIMSVYGSFLQNSLQTFRQYSQRFNVNDLCTDVIQNSIISLIKGMHLGFIIVKNRNPDQSLIIIDETENENGNGKRNEKENDKKK
jgi:hypothetical protein